MPERYRDMTPDCSAALPSSSSRQVVEWAQPEPEAIDARLPAHAQVRFHADLALPRAEGSDFP